MALIECNECSNKVSDAAVTCPHCGISITTKPLENESSGKQTGLSEDEKKYAFIVIFVVVILVLLIWYNSPYQECLREAPDWLCKAAKNAAKYK